MRKEDSQVCVPTRYKRRQLIFQCREEMCELKVIIDKALVFENAVYATTTGNSVVVKDIMGKSKEFKNYTITEVNITKEQLLLSPKTQN
jgi:predicted RNA-binding protein